MKKKSAMMPSLNELKRNQFNSNASERHLEAHPLREFCWQIMPLAGVIALLTIVLHFFDEAISRFATSKNSFFIEILRSSTNGAKAIYWLIFCVLVIGVCLAAFKMSKSMRLRRLCERAFEWAGVTVASLIAASIPVEILKVMIGRARPEEIDALGSFSFAPFAMVYVYESFPSGHAMTAGVLAITCAYYLPRYRWLFLILFMLLALSRIFVGAHYPTDVLVGFSLGAITASFLLLFLRSKRLIIA